MIYVDALKACLKTPMWRHRQSCHLFCDGDLRELHRFALRIGLKRAWFQDHSFPHYDLTARKRELAVRLGVTDADLRTTVLLIRWWRRQRTSLT
jgi:hypothetical protein